MVGFEFLMEFKVDICRVILRILCMMGGRWYLCSSDVYGQRHGIRAYSENRQQRARGFVTIDVFVSLYIRSGKTQHFLDVVYNKYAFVFYYNIWIRMRYKVD